MTTNGLNVWNYEENNHLIKSLVGSVVEFREIYKNRVLGTIDKCDKNSYTLAETHINGQYFGHYVIHDYEIDKWRVKELRQTIDSHKKQRAQTSKPNNDSRVLIPIHMNGAEEEDRESEDNDYYECDLEAIDLNEDDDPIVVNLKSLSLKASNDIILIDKIDDNFEKVIESIMRSNCVGFALFGQEISREGSVDVMAFATADAIYVFDAYNKDIILRMKQLLESEELQKIMFSCRQSSDALSHLFDIQLNNVLDIRIHDYFLQKKESIKAFNNSRLYVKPELRSFERLLAYYLRLKWPNLYINLDYKQLSVRVENMIRIKTIFLRELLAIINYKLNEEIYQMTERCVRSLRSAQGLEFIAMKDDERELELIECPINDSEEVEKRIISLSSIKPINNEINRTNGLLIQKNCKPNMK